MAFRRRIWGAIFLVACSGESALELQSDAGGAGNVDAGNQSGDDAGTGGQDGDPGAVDVAGQLLGFGGAPLASVSVRIGSTTVQTDATGHFSATVATPYDLVVRDGNDTYVFLGVTRSDPTLRLGTSATTKSADVQGRVTTSIDGASFPLANDAYVDVTFVGAPGYYAERLNPGDGAGYGSFPVEWGQGDTLSGYLLAVYSTYTGSTFTPPLGVAVKPIELSDGAAIGAQDGSTPETTLELAAPDMRAVSVDVTLPDGASLDYYSHALGTYSRSVASPATSFTVDVVDGLPSDLPQRIRLEGHDTENHILQWSRVVGDATAIDVVMPAAAHALTPASGASLGPDGTLAFVPQQGGISFVSLQWHVTDPTSERTVDYSVRVATAGASVSLARLASLDVELASELQWAVSGIGPLASVDAYLGPDESPGNELIGTIDQQRLLTLAP